MTRFHFQAHIASDGTLTLPPIPGWTGGETEAEIVVLVPRSSAPEEERKKAPHEFFEGANRLKDTPSRELISKKQIRAARLEEKYGDKTPEERKAAGKRFYEMWDGALHYGGLISFCETGTIGKEVRPMMLFVLLDSNVVLDFALRRGSFYAPAAKIMKEVAEGRLIGHVSSSQITDIYYFIRKEHPPERAIEMIASLVETIEVLRVDRETIDAALGSGMSDFEDAVQAAAAESAGIDMVVTRDEQGFAGSNLRVYTPERFWEALKGT